MINYDVDRGVTVSEEKMGSSLTLAHATPTDSGNYTCSPYNVRPSSVTVHVLSQGNSAAAVQNGKDSGATKIVSTDGKSSSAGGDTPPSAAVQSSAEVAVASLIMVTMTTLVTGLL